MFKILVPFLLAHGVAGAVHSSQRAASAASTVVDSAASEYKFPPTIRVAGVTQELCGVAERDSPRRLPEPLIVGLYMERQGLSKAMNPFLRSVSGEDDEDIIAGSGFWRAVRDARVPRTLVIKVPRTMEIYDLVSDVDKNVRKAGEAGEDEFSVGAANAFRKLLYGGLRERGMKVYKGTKVAVAEARDGTSLFSVSGKSKGVIEQKGFFKTLIETFCGDYEMECDEARFAIGQGILSMCRS